MGIWMGEISTATLNSYLKRNVPAANPICYLQQVRWSSFVGVDRAAQSEIEKDRKSLTHYPFRQPFSTADGRKFVARIGLAEECYTGAAGAIVVIQDSSSGMIENVEMFFTPFMFLFPQEERGLITRAGCLECDNFDVLVYDVKSRKFTWESE
jgi:hypothetical protein